MPAWLQRLNLVNHSPHLLYLTAVSYTGLINISRLLFITAESPQKYLRKSTEVYKNFIWKIQFEAISIHRASST